MPKTVSSAMALEPAVVIFDACVGYPFHLRNIVVQIAVTAWVTRVGPMKFTTNGFGLWPLTLRRSRELTRVCYEETHWLCMAGFIQGGSAEGRWRTNPSYS